MSDVELKAEELDVMLKFKKMGGDRVPVLLVTANVGSIFEDPSVMLPIWTAEFLQFVSKMEPKFIGLHLQEVGGKTYEKSMQYVQDFVQRLCDSPELRLFDKVRIFLDEDFSSPEKFTALGNMYFAHSSLTDVRLWDFEVKAWVSAEGREVHHGNIEKITTKEKAKFPQQFFPECKWSRKGFLRTRWQIRGTAVEFVNIHLFHDASNLTALEPYPSVYCRSRRRALTHTLRHLHDDANAAPYFIFGDFNFRTDTDGVVKKLTEELAACRLQNGQNCDSSKLQYKDDRERPVLTVGKKEFCHADHQKVFREPWLLRYDRELEALRQHLYEYPVKFPPSYPFEEDVHLPTHYMKTRCPAWCDRVLLSQTARLLVQHQDGQRAGENRHIHTSRRSVAESTDSSGRASSSDSSPARSASPHHTQSNSKTREKQGNVSDMDGLLVPGINVSRKSIADPTGIQHAINSRVVEADSSPVRRRLVRNQSEGSPKPGDPAFSNELRRLADAPAMRRRVDYGVVGEATCMGDHKPVYLRLMLQSERGTVSCSSLNRSCAFCINYLPSTLSMQAPRLPRLPTDPDLYSAVKKLKSLVHVPSGSFPDRANLLGDDFIRKRALLKRSRTGSLNDGLLKIPDVEITSAEYSSFDGIFVNSIDTALLYSTIARIDPYTPESVDSHSPNPEPGSGSESDEISAEIADVLIPDSEMEKPNRFKLTRDRSVSPTQLKSRLDKLLTLERSDSTRKPYVKPIPELVRLNSGDSEKFGEAQRENFCCYASKCLTVCRRRICNDCDLCEVCCGRTGCNQCCRGRLGDCCTS